jgi:hypothetical protein
VTTDPSPLLAALSDPSPAVVAEALRRVRFRDLKDPAVLEAVFRCCADERAVAGAEVAARDPFAAFFSDTPREAATLAAIAAERLEKAGLPEETASAVRLASVLDALPAAGPLGAVGARLLGETRWPDPEAAVRALVPALCRHDVALFQVLVTMPSTVLDTVCALAAAPLRPRLLQELMNHAPSQDAAVRALVASVEAGAAGLDETLAVTAVSTLVAWNRKEAAGVAARLEADWPLLLAWRALDDAAERPRLHTAVAAGALGDPDRFWPRVAEVLRHREPLPGYPIAAFLRATGADHGVLSAVGVDDDAAEVLHDWVAALDVDPDRAWAAVEHLLAAGKLGRSRAPVESAIAGADPERWPPFDGPLLTALAAVSPPLAGLPELCRRAVALDATVVGAVVAALSGQPDAALRPIAVAALARAADAPRVTERVSARAVRERAEGVDVDALEPWLPRLDPDLRAAFEAHRSVVRAG